VSEYLTETQSEVLDAIERLQPVEAAQIAAYLGRHRTVIYQQAVKLHAAGWLSVEREGRTVRWSMQSGAVPLTMPNPGRVPSVWAYAQQVAA